MKGFTNERIKNMTITEVVSTLEQLSDIIYSLTDRKKAQWKQSSFDVNEKIFNCSNCGYELIISSNGDGNPLTACGWKYCPRCGCKMEDEDETLL